MSLKFETARELIKKSKRQRCKKCIKDNESRDYREVYSIAKEAYDADIAEESKQRYSSDMGIVFDYIHEVLLKKYEHLEKTRQERLDKLRELHAPDIILQNECRVLGEYSGKAAVLRRILRIVNMVKALDKSGITYESLVWDLITNVGVEKCDNCAYNCRALHTPTEKEIAVDGDDEPYMVNECLCGTSDVFCEGTHFKVQSEPFYRVMERQKGSYEERYRKADEEISERNKKDWEAEGCPDYSSEIDDLKKRGLVYEPQKETDN